MKKNLLALFAPVIAVGANAQPTNAYCPSHIDAAAPESEKSAFIGIRCATALDNYDGPAPALPSEEFAPSDGAALPPSERVLQPGGTAFAILDCAVRCDRTRMEYRCADKNGLGRVCVQGIRYLYEFFCSSPSGGMYRADGGLPDYGCPEHEPQGGRAVGRRYPCAPGSDVGCVRRGGENP